MKYFRLAALLFLSLFLASCASQKTKQYFETDAKKIEKAKSDDFDKSLARVFFFRERSFTEELNFMQAPVYFGLDGKLIAVMPLGSYVVLYLRPGTHMFHSILAARGESQSSTVFKQRDHVETLIAGDTHFIGVKFGWTSTFDSIDPIEGERIIANSAPAKLLYGLRTVGQFKEYILDAPKASQGSSQSTSVATNTQGSNLGNSAQQDFLPSKEQVQNFVEGVAAVLLIGLLIFGLAAGQADSPSSSPPQAYQSPPALIQPSRISQLPLGQGLGGGTVPTTVRNSYGSVTEIIKSKEEVEIRNRNTGVTYRVEDGRIRGSDGSRMRVIGKTIYSDTGQQYSIVGGDVYTPDGRRCHLVFETIRCE